MNANTLSLIAFVAGIAMTTQASMNARLGALVNNALFATSVAFLSSFIFISLILFLFSKKLPELHTIKTIPIYLWFAGGLLSSFGVATFYWLIPKIGVSSLITFALSGQLVAAMISSHFGWFQLPQSPITATKLAGLACLLVGVILSNKA